MPSQSIPVVAAVVTMFAVFIATLLSVSVSLALGSRNGARGAEASARVN
jgi:hypothetical protein